MDHNTIIYDPTAKLQARAGHLSRRFRKTAKLHERSEQDQPRTRTESPRRRIHRGLTARGGE